MRAFRLHPCLRDPEEEQRYLRCCARLLLLCLLPARDARSHSLRAVLVEIVANKGDAQQHPYNAADAVLKILKQQWQSQMQSLRVIEDD